jgi:L-threonylcarbamoyladenylate synthase
MTARLLSVDPDHPDPEVVAAAAEEILRGGVVSLPTDTLYGLSCSLFDPVAVQFVHRMKGRPPGLSVIALVAEPGDAEALVLEVPEIGERLVREFWPGPLTIVFRASPVVPAASRGGRDTIALRCPAHALSQALVQAVGGPIVSTSANRSGDPPARSAQEVERIFGNQVALVLDGGAARSTTPSTIVDVTGREPVVLRSGAVDLGDWLAAHARARGASSTVRPLS